MRKLVLVLAVSMVALVVPGVAGAKTIVNVTACKVDVPGSAQAVLQQDLACDNDQAFRLEDNASLNLNGHTLTVATDVDNGLGAVYCVSRCTVFGGTIVDSRPSGNGAQISAGALKMHDVQLSAPTVGVGVITSTLQLTNVTAGGPFARFEVLTKMTAKNVSVTTTGVQPNGPNVCLMATSIFASVKATDVHLQGCNIWSFGNVTGKRLTVTGSSDWGIATSGSILKLTDSTITGNPVDIASATKPKLTTTTCGTSAMANTFDGSPVPATTWHVCTNDAP